MGYKNKEDKQVYSRWYVETHREQVNTRNRAYAKKQRDEWFTGKVCVDCGGTDRLEVDHLDPATKVSNINWKSSKKQREAELSKCTVRCYHCHKKRTALQQSHPIIHGLYVSYHRRGCRCELCGGASVMHVSRKILRKIAAPYFRLYK
jgi:hypothetical protein